MMNLQAGILQNVTAEYAEIWPLVCSIGHATMNKLKILLINSLLKVGYES